MFAGGVDPSFRGAGGAVFEAPNSNLVVTDTAVDGYGRVVIVGHGDSGQDGQSFATMGRLNFEGRRDPTFASLGAFDGTPRGVTKFGQVVALEDGGYVVSGSTDDGQQRLVAFDHRGRVDSSFGRNGVVITNGLRVSQLLQQPDGKIIAVGTAGTPFLDDGRSIRNAAIRLLADGTLDTSYGRAGWADAGLASSDESSQLTTNEITSASLDTAGRLLLAITNTITPLHDPANNAHATSTTLRRFGGNGRPDPKFVGTRINRDSTEQGTDGLDVLPAVSVGRADGHIVVLTRKRGEPNFPIDITLRGAHAQIPEGRIQHNAIITNGVFVVQNLADGAIAATEDNKIVVAGSLLEGSTLTPALVRFNADLTRDFTFGTNGFMRLPTTGGAVEVAEVTANQDGTLTAVLAAPRVAGARAGNPTVVRVFQDDEPVVTFRSATRKGGQIRVTASMRGINRIDISSVDSRDLRLIDADGGRAKARPLSLISHSNGNVTATYSFTRAVSTYSILAIGNQIEDEVNGESVERTIATVTV